MKIVIVGLGKVGRTILASLVKERHNVFAIDTDPEVVEKIRSKYDVMALCASGTEYDVLQEAGVSKTELFIAVTGSDELNMLCCLIAKKAGNCQTIARIRNPEYSSEAPFLKEELGLAMVINPEFAFVSITVILLSFSLSCSASVCPTFPQPTMIIFII